MLSVRRAQSRAQVFVRSLSSAHVSEPKVPRHSYEPPPDLSSVDGWEDFQHSRFQTKSLIDALLPFGSTQLPENTWKPRDATRNPPSPSNTTLSALLASGAHFGHATSRLNPNFMPYAYGSRSGITIIDLDQTLSLLRRAANVVRAVAMAGGQILFLGTRPDLQPIVQKAAERLDGAGFYIGTRWLPGTLSNRVVMFRPDELEGVKIEPDLVIVLNPIDNPTALNEFTQHNIPTIGIVDSNFDPRVVMYPIPANDESTRTAELICGVLSVAAREGIAMNIGVDESGASLSDHTQLIDEGEDVLAEEDGELEEIAETAQTAEKDSLAV